MNTCRNNREFPLQAGAFTAIELLVVIAMIGLGALMLAPAFARSRTKSSAPQCMNNLRQVVMAWIMYADDNNSQLVYNENLGAKSPGNESWVGGWLDFTSSTDNTNVALLIDHNKHPNAAYLGPYLKTAAVFKCPADFSTAPIAGGPMPRVRSISMNSYVGTGSHLGTGGVGISPPLPKTNMAQILSPVDLFIVLEEHPGSINDGWFAAAPDTLFQMVEYPASHHGNSGGFAFADGHTEMHKWQDPRTMPALQYGQLLTFNVNLPGDKDVLWIAQHAAGVTKYP